MVRLIGLIFLFLLSLLAVFNAPAYYLWLVAIAVTEYPLIFVGITIAVLVCGFWAKTYKLPGHIIGGIALLLYLSPIARSYNIATTLAEDMDIALGKITHLVEKPFSPLRMFSSAPEVPYTTLNY